MKNRSDCETSKTLTVTHIIRKSRGKTGQITKIFSTALDFRMYRKSTWTASSGLWLPCEIPWYCPLLSPVTGISLLQWDRKYMTLNMSCVQLNNETRVNNDGPDGWVNGWFYFGDDPHQHLRRQNQSGRVLLLGKKVLSVQWKLRNTTF